MDRNRGELESGGVLKIRGGKLLVVNASLVGILIAYQNCSSGGFDATITELASGSNQIQSDGPSDRNDQDRAPGADPGVKPKQCVHPDSNLSVDGGTKYVYYSMGAGTQVQCDAAKITSTCQASTGRYSPVVLSNRYSNCVVNAGTGPNAVVAGAITVPYPTLENLSIEWAVSGDQNLNSSVGVRYRKLGDSVWKNGMALKYVPAATHEGFSWGTRHTGSVLDLQPATQYEIELTLSDADGGSVVQSITAATRAIPVPMANAPVKSVNPSTLVSVLANARPGDIIQLTSGTYSGFQVNVNGESGKPIVVRGAAGVTINGEIGVFQKNHIYFEGINLVGRIRYNGSKNISVVRSTIQGTAALGGDGIVTYTRAENSYIADNVVTGTTVWAESSLGVNGSNLGEGICVNGPGHVIMNNRVSGFRDSISLMEDDEADDQQSIDIINNEISISADDGVEADFCKQNCRVMRNVLTNSFIALSSQPSLGGPTYFIRNVIYNAVHLSFKLYRGSIGDVILHNTVVKNGDGLGVYAGRAVARALIANNLIIGGPGGTYNGYSSGSGRVISFPDLQTSTSYINYQAYGTANGTFNGTIGSATFTSLSGLRANTSEKNSVQIDLSVFVNPLNFPSAPMNTYPKSDLRVRPGSAVENAALRINNINDDFTGSGAEIGAYETGAMLPIYGPR